MIRLTDFKFLRHRITPSGQRQLQGSVTEHGPWFRLTKREVQALTVATAQAAKAQKLRELSQNTTPEAT